MWLGASGLPNALVVGNKITVMKLEMCYLNMQIKIQLHINTSYQEP